MGINSQLDASTRSFTPSILLRFQSSIFLACPSPPLQTHTHAHTYTHSQTHTHNQHTHTNTHKYTHTHTHTHTHAHSFSLTRTHTYTHGLCGHRVALDSDCWHDSRQDSYQPLLGRVFDILASWSGVCDCGRGENESGVRRCCIQSRATLHTYPT